MQETGPAALARRPLLWLGACLCAGVLVERYAGAWLPAVLAAGGAAVLLGAGVRARGRPLPAAGVFSRPGWLTRAGELPVLLGLGLLLAGAGGWRMQACGDRIEAGRRVLQEQIAKSAYIECRLRLLQPPETALAHEESGFWKAPAMLERIDGVASEVAVLVYGEGVRDLRRDDVLTGRGVLYADRPPAWPGAFSYSEYLKGLGLSGRMKLLPGKSGGASSGTTADAGLVGAAGEAGVRAAGFTLERPAGFGVMRWLDDLRAAGIRQDLRLLPGQSGAFVAAALYGYRDDLDQATNDSFRYVGIGHILAISGMNVGMVVGLVWWVFARFTHDRRKLAGVCLLVCVSYMIISGGQVTAVRAGVIAVIYLAGFFVSRRSDFMNSLGAAAILLVAYNPFTLFSLSFQLSFAAVIAISCLDREYKRLMPAWFPEQGAGGNPARETSDAKAADGDASAGTETAWWRAGWRWLARSVWLLALMSATAFAGVWGLMAWAFSQVSFSGLLVNIVVIPLMTFSLAGGMLLPFADLLPAAVEPYAAWLLGLPTDWMLWIAKKGMWLPGGGVLVYQPPWWLLCAHYGLLGAFLGRSVIPSGGWWRWLRGGLWTLLVLSTAWLVWYCMGPEARPERSVTVLPGGGDCAIFFDGAGGVRVAGELQRGGEDLIGFLRFRRVGHVDDLLSLPVREQEQQQAADEVMLQRLRRQIPLERARRLPWPAVQAEGERGTRGMRASRRGERLLWMPGGVEGVSAMSFDGERTQGWVLDVAGARWGFGGWLWPEQCAALAQKTGADAAGLFVRVRGRKAYQPPQGVYCAGQGALSGGVARDAFGVFVFEPLVDAAPKAKAWCVRAWNGREWVEPATVSGDNAEPAISPANAR